MEFNANHAKAGIAGAIGLVLIIVGANSFVVIDPGQVGLVENVGKINENSTITEGFHLKLPILSRVRIYSATVQKPTLKSAAATKDAQTVNAEVTVMYRVDTTKMVPIRRNLGDMPAIDAFVQQIAQEEFKKASAGFTAEELITRRGEVKTAFDAGLKDRLATQHLTFVESAVIDLQFGQNFSEAIEAKQVAQQRAKQAEYDAARAKAEATAVVARAKGQAEAQKLLAETLNNNGGTLVLQKEWIEAWKAGGSQVPQVMVMGEGGNPFLLNLPPEVMKKAQTKQ